MLSLGVTLFLFVKCYNTIIVCDVRAISTYYLKHNILQKVQCIPQSLGIIFIQREYLLQPVNNSIWKTCLSQLCDCAMDIMEQVVKWEMAYK